MILNRFLIAFFIASAPCCFAEGSAIAEDKAKHAVEIRVDSTETPDLQEWAAQLKKEAETFYPMAASKLGGEGLLPAQFSFVIKKGMKESGSSSGNTISLGEEYFKTRPKEFGTAIFYMIRAMQPYKTADAPGWLVTGIADYLRWWNYESAEKRHQPDFRHSKYTNGFSDAAAFLVWMENTIDKEIVRKLNEALLKGEYTGAFFKQTAGKDPAELWNDYVAFRVREIEQEAQKAIDKSIPKPAPISTSVTFDDIGAVEFAPPEKGLTIRYTLDGSFPVKTSYASGSPVQVASSLKLRAACFNSEGKCSEGVEVECVRKPAADQEKKDPDARFTAAINADFSETPDMKDWALRAVKESQEYYSTMVQKLKIAGYDPPRQVTYIFKEKLDGMPANVPAYAISDEQKIFFLAPHIRANSNDYGMVIHELTHIIQKYSYSKNAPSWVVEGIADYIRWENWEPVNRRRHINPMKAKYTNGYSDASAFFNWIEQTYDKELVRKLNEALFKKTYSDALFKKYTGKDLPDLWKEFVASLQK